MSMNQETTSKRQQCTFIKVDGSRCTAWAALNGLCIGHQPNSAEYRAKGGKNRATKARMDKKLPLQIRHIVVLLEKAMVEVYQGQLPIGRGQAMASLGNAIVKAYESGIMEERLTALEKKIGGNDGRQ
jgi:hypothetical protein